MKPKAHSCSFYDSFNFLHLDLVWALTNNIIIQIEPGLEAIQPVSLIWVNICTIFVLIVIIHFELNEIGNEYQYAAGGHQAAGANEIFAEDQSDKPWWRTNFFISQPILFGTWDGVFTSVLINIFGVIVFLRSGWVVAQAGIFNGILPKNEFFFD